MSTAHEIGELKRAAVPKPSDWPPDWQRPASVETTLAMGAMGDAIDTATKRIQALFGSATMSVPPLNERAAVGGAIERDAPKRAKRRARRSAVRVPTRRTGQSAHIARRSYCPNAAISVVSNVDIARRVQGDSSRRIKQRRTAAAVGVASLGAAVDRAAVAAAASERRHNVGAQARRQ